MSLSQSKLPGPLGPSQALSGPLIWLFILFPLEVLLFYKVRLFLWWLRTDGTVWTRDVSTWDCEDTSEIFLLFFSAVIVLSVMKAELLFRL